ncbi:MAG: hypothetical protein NW224_20740 [Leptolyngbyaceae cyanobacterium bins.302]|nr:hypothetical protein [Leptolyngbyaceae cyanobacterium bins.302]
MNDRLNRAHELKQALTDFVLDAEGELAVALEKFSAEQLSRSQQQDMHQRSLVVDRFLIEGTVGDSTPIQLFLAEEPDLSTADRQLVQGWQRGFVGLFEVVQILPDGFELMNWTTTKHYTVKPADEKALAAMARLKVGEIILTQIAPADDATWMFFSPWTSLGKLGKPKLAVAIGNFKQNYKRHLYSDAPDLLEEAWSSVEQYHQNFIDFFGSDEVTLSGYQLSKKLAELQEQTMQAQLDAAGIDGSKSLKELAAEAGTSDEELAEAAEAMGMDASAATQLLEKKGAMKMAPAQVELPPHLKNAEQVTALTHPRWGQLFLPNYQRFTTMLEQPDTIAPDAEKLVKHFLDNAEINRFVWQKLAAQYPAQLETVLQTTLARPNFRLQSDLDDLLSEHGKLTEPELPEVASVPLHLHNLFQDALLEIKKEKPKGKAKPQKTGFGAR